MSGSRRKYSRQRDFREPRKNFSHTNKFKSRDSGVGGGGFYKKHAKIVKRNQKYL